jgi:hypothetical protein
VNEAWRQFMISTSDAALLLLMMCLLGFTIDSWRARWADGLVVRRFSEFSLAMLIFFGWFSLVYWDRRYNIVPGIDLADLMTAEYYWPLRIMLALTMWRLWWVMKPR